MSEAKHTPGPWHVEDATGNAFDLPAHLNSNLHRSFLIVATVEPIAKTIAVHTEYGLRSEADARLIAAAPDLLAALKDLVEDDVTPEPDCLCHLCPPCRDCEKHAGRRELLAHARAAIAKAEGGAA